MVFKKYFLVDYGSMNPQTQKSVSIKLFCAKNTPTFRSGAIFPDFRNPSPFFSFFLDPSPFFFHSTYVDVWRNIINRDDVLNLTNLNCYS